MRRDVFVYLSGPISPKNGRTVEVNVAAALAVYLDCLKRGILAFCPHLSAIFPSAHTAITYDIWMEADYAIIDRCTHVLMLDGWQFSKGACDELAYATLHGKPAIYSLDEIERAWPAVKPEDQQMEHLKMNDRELWCQIFIALIRAGATVEQAGKSATYALGVAPR
jgi:hypothetical protein